MESYAMTPAITHGSPASVHLLRRSGPIAICPPGLQVDGKHAWTVPAPVKIARANVPPKDRGVAQISVREYEELLAFCQSRVADPDCARDIVQDCFVRMLAMERTETHTGQRRALLRLMAMHLMVDLKRRETVRLRHECASRQEALRQPMPRHLQPEELCASSQTMQAYRDVISALPPRCRQVFCLYAFDGLPNGKIALLMGISLSMVNKHIGRARRACAACKLALDGPAAPPRAPRSAR